MHWIAHLFESQFFGNNLEKDIEQQLRSDFKVKIGRDFPSNCILMPPLPEPFAIQQFGEINAIEGDLVIEATGIAVRICWMTDAPGSKDKGQITAWWDHLPKDEILEALLPLKLDLKGKTWEFQLHSNFHTWPTVMLQMEGPDLDPKAVENLLQFAQRTYNASHDEIIHSIGKSSLKGNMCSTLIDFGSAAEDGLFWILDTLGTWGTQISKVNLADPNP
jgi:hypothetical protein